MSEKNKQTTRFVPWALLALVLLVHVFGPNVCTVYSEQKFEKQDNYPATPEGVVMAFVQATFNGDSHEIIGDVRKGLRYTTWGDRYPSSDSDCIALRYDVTRWVEAPDKVNVKVVYQSVDVLSAGAEGGPEERTVFEEVVYYELLKEKVSGGYLLLPMLDVFLSKLRLKSWNMKQTIIKTNLKE